MKKFYMILAALLIGSMCFAQEILIPMVKWDKPINGFNNRSAWVGNLASGGYASIEAGYEYGIAPKQFDANISGTITKVKFYHDISEADGITNTSYTIKIYTNYSFGGSYASQGFYDITADATVYTQNYTATESGWQEVPLTTPYAITSTNFFVAIQCAGKSYLPIGGEATAVLGQSYFQVDMSSYNLGTKWTAPNVFDQARTLYNVGMAVYVDDGGSEVVASDFEAKLFGGLEYDEENQQLQLTPAPAQYTIGTTDDLVIYPFYQNNGPSVATSGTLTATVKLGGTSFGTSATRTFTTDNPAEVGGGYNTFYESTYGAVTITAAEMDAMGLGNTFDVCYEISYDGNDPVTANNSFCIPVTRTDAVCDIQAKLYTDAQLTAEVGGTMTLAADENFTVYPVILNVGPDAAAGTLTLDVQVEGISVLQTGPQSMSLASNPLQVNDPMNLMPSGFTYTPEQMSEILSALGITDNTFEVCLISSYSGNDPNTNNNTKCVTVTRQTVAVEENIAASVSVYPNPANDMFTVANAEGATIVVVNSLGQVVSSIENAASNQTIDASNFANGTYFVKVNESVIKINVVK